MTLATILREEIAKRPVERAMTFPALLQYMREIKEARADDLALHSPMFLAFVAAGEGKVAQRRDRKWEVKP